MSFELLRRVSCRHLPYLAARAEEIDEVANLREAGLVSALMPERGPDGYVSHATVLKITDKGRFVLDFPEEAVG